MTTSFGGTKLLRYPIPRVLEPSVAFGFSGGNTSETNSGELSQNTTTTGALPGEIGAQTQFNSMYDFRII
jgi:hypothetical protein